MIKHIVFWRMKKEANGNDMYENIRIAAEKLDTSYLHLQRRPLLGLRGGDGV